MLPLVLVAIVGGLVDVNIDGDPTTPQVFQGINTEGRTQDYVAAYATLRTAYPTGNIFAVVKGVSYDHITNVEAQPNSTLLVLTVGGTSIPRTVVVKSEEIEQLGLRSIKKPSVQVHFPNSIPPANDP